MNRMLILCVIFAVLFLMQVNATCYRTGCHAHSATSWCPQGMQTASWHYCWGIFGKEENCCTWD